MRIKYLDAHTRPVKIIHIFRAFMDFNKLTLSSQSALSSCRTLLEKYEHSVLEPEHILISLIEQPNEIVPQIFDRIGVGKKQILDKLHDYLSKQPKGRASVSSGEQVVASKNGTKYHYPWCAGAKQIAEKNKITFASTEEARAKGYTPAANCKGLK